MLPATAYSRIGWLRHNAPFFDRLYGLLTTAGKDWTSMAGKAAHVGTAGDPQQTLLDIVGLHPSSVEYYSRTAESVSELFNVQNLFGFGSQFFAALQALGAGKGRGGTCSPRSATRARRRTS